MQGGLEYGRRVRRGGGTHRTFANVEPLHADTLFFIERKVAGPETKCRRGEQTGGHLVAGGDFNVARLLPDGDEHVGEVGQEVDDAATGRGQLGLGEENADQEAQQHRHHREHHQEGPDHHGVAVEQHLAVLRAERKHSEEKRNAGRRRRHKTTRNETWAE